MTSPRSPLQRKSSDSIRVTTVVKVARPRAFALFTKHIDSWWRRDPRFRLSEDPGRLRFDGTVGGRLVEEGANGTFVVGEVLAWEPPQRLHFEFRNHHFREDEKTEVEIWFEDHALGTRLTLEHRGWDRLPHDHPAKHGLRGNAFTSIIGLWWADLFGALANAPSEHAQDGSEGSM